MFDSLVPIADVDRDIEACLPLPRVNGDELVSQPDLLFLVLVLEQHLVDVQEQALDSGLRENTRDGLDLHARQLRRLGQHVRLDVLQLLGVEPLAVGLNASAVALHLLDQLEHRERLARGERDGDRRERLIHGP